MRLLGLAALGYMLPAVSQACSGFLDAGCKIVEVNDREMPKYLNLIADCPGGGILTQPLKFNIFNGNGHLLWLMNSLANIMDCTDFDVTEAGEFSATCNGTRTSTLKLSMFPSLIIFLNLYPANMISTAIDDHIALINYKGTYALCPNDECCSGDLTVRPNN